MFDTLASWDPFTAYDPLLALYDEGKVSVRVRILLPEHGPESGCSADHPTSAQCVQQFRRRHGPQFWDRRVRYELADCSTRNTPPTNFITALTIVAQRGWAFQQHSLSLFEDQFIAGVFGMVNNTTPIADLRWSVAHVPQIDQMTVNKLKAIGPALPSIRSAI